jgi:ribokinase
MGEDFLGTLLKNFYENEKMSLEHVVIDKDAETASALIEVDEADAQNRIIVILAANEQVGRESVLAAEADFADSDAVLTQFETTPEAVFAAKELSHKYGKPFILNPAPYIDIDKSVFDGVDYVTPNESEAEQFTGIAVNTVEDCRAAAQKFFELGVKNVVITLGVRGAYFNDGQREITVPALKVKAVETTGAGDAFNGGFVTAICEGMDVETALKFANCTAAISVTRLGAAQSMPSREEIDAFMKEKYGI